jgi:chloramphenicol-sensitive protein RarD
LRRDAVLNIGKEGKAKEGVWYALGAYAFWGMFPVYWKALGQVPAPQLLCHRILWSFVWLSLVLAVTGKRVTFRRTTLRGAVFLLYSAAAALIGVNWLTYVWAVNAGFIVETSLGYFINPLLSVLMGVLILRERLRPRQWIPICLAAVGILYMTYAHGTLPWIALLLASTWATYGLIKKLAPLGPSPGLALETGILLLPVLSYLVYADLTGKGVFLHTSLSTDLLLVGAGVTTTIPLFLFAVAVRRIPLSLVGILRYIAPTIQFLLGVLVYKEPFTSSRVIGFGIVWLALVIFGMESFVTHRVRRLQSSSQGLR